MLKRCALPGCYGIGVVSDPKTDTGRTWYCSQACARQAFIADGKCVIHYVPDGHGISACVGVVVRSTEDHRLTGDVAKTSCGNCKRTRIYKEAVNQAA